MSERTSKLFQMAEEIDRNLRDLRRSLWKPVEEETARINVTPPQRTVMQLLFNSEGLSLKELSRQVGLSHSTVSGIVDRLERKGLLERQPDPRDRRSARILVPPQVRRHGRARMKSLALHPLAEALRRARPKERKLISEGLSALRRLLGESAQ